MAQSQPGSPGELTTFENVEALVKTVKDLWDAPMSTKIVVGVTSLLALAPVAWWYYKTDPLKNEEQASPSSLGSASATAAPTGGTPTAAAPTTGTPPTVVPTTGTPTTAASTTGTGTAEPTTAMPTTHVQEQPGPQKGTPNGKPWGWVTWLLVSLVILMIIGGLVVIIVCACKSGGDAPEEPLREADEALGGPEQVDIENQARPRG